MSALGQKQTFAPQKLVSALCSAVANVRFGPIADIALFRGEFDPPQ
jgi:hypothetical protein